MKKVTNTWNEPIIIHLTKKVPGKTTPDMSVRQLLVDEHTNIEDDQVSDELRLMKRKGRVSIEDVDGSEPTKEEAAPEPAKVNEPLPDEPAEDEDLKKLETELLQSEPDPMEG